jgi:hypothetical protein
MTDTKKRERFTRLAQYRTNEIIKRINVLGHCANRSAYSFNEQEINKIFNAIEKKLKVTKAKFRFSKKDSEFKL